MLDYLERARIWLVAAPTEESAPISGMEARGLSSLGVVLFLVILIHLLPVTLTAAPKWVRDAATIGDTITVDRDALIVTLFLSNETKISDDGTAKQLVRTAYKVLATDGIRLAAMRELAGEGTRVKNISGWLIDSRGKRHELKDRDIYEMAEAQAGTYDDAKVVGAEFPETRVGDIVAWEYEIDQDDYPVGFSQTFVLQVDQPVAEARYEVTVPDGWQIHVSGQGMEPLTYSRDGNKYLWVSGYLPYRKEEPFMPPCHSVARVIEVNCFSVDEPEKACFADWSRVVQWAAEINELQRPPADSIVKLASGLCAGLTDPWEKLKVLAEYARDRIRYVAVEIGEGRFRPREALNICVNRYGDCKDKAALTRALLDVVGVKSYAVLANPKVPIDRNFPSPFQFNHVIVAIPVSQLPGFNPQRKSCTGGCLFFDPTSTSTLLGSLPPDLQGTFVLKLSPTDTGLTRLPDLAPDDCLRKYVAKAELSSNFHLSATVTITDYAYSADWTRWYRQQNQAQVRMKEAQQMFAESMSNVVLANYSTGDDGDSVWASFALEGDYSITDAGNVRLLKADFFHPDPPDEFVENERTFPIILGATDKQVTEIDWKFPEGWMFDGSMERIDASCSAAHVTSSLTSDGANAHYRSVVELRKKSILPDEYRAVRDYYTKYRSACRTRAILKKQ